MNYFDKVTVGRFAVFDLLVPIGIGIMRKELFEILRIL